MATSFMGCKYKMLLKNTRPNVFDQKNIGSDKIFPIFRSSICSNLCDPIWRTFLVMWRYNWVLEMPLL